MGSTPLPMELILMPMDTLDTPMPMDMLDTPMLMDTLDTPMSMPLASVMPSPRLMLMLLLSTLLPMELILMPMDTLDIPMLMDTLDTPLPTATESKKLELHSYLLKDFT